MYQLNTAESALLPPPDSGRSLPVSMKQNERRLLERADCHVYPEGKLSAETFLESSLGSRNGVEPLLS